MNVILNGIHAFFSTFGAPVFVPVIIYFLALILKVKPRKAFISALSAGVGLEGFTLVINAYTPIISPVIKQMIHSTGIHLAITDLGWQPSSIVAYSTQAGMIYLALAIIIQVVLFLVHYTNVFQAGDLWNNYSYFLWGSMLYVKTHNMWLAIALMILLQLCALLNTEIIEERWSKYYQYPQCSIASLHTTSIALWAIPMNWLLNKLGLYKVKADPETAKRRLGFIGDPMTLGLMLGVIIGLVGNVTRLNVLAAWGEIFTCGVATASVMAVFPKIASIFSGSFTAITDASRKSLKGQGWYLAVNDAAGYGENATLITGILLMPITLGLAFILPGNQTLPMIDLVAIPYFIQPIIAMSNGNVIKSLISGIFYMCLMLYACTATGPLYTAVAKSVGISVAAGTMITTFGMLGQPEACVIFFMFLSRNPLWIGLAVVLYAICYVLVHRGNNLDKIHDWLEQQALDPAGTHKKSEAKTA